MKVIMSAIQMISTDDIDKNLQTAARLIEQAVDEGAQMVVLPEAFVFFGGDDEQWASNLTLETEQRLIMQMSEWARQYNCWLVTGTLPFVTRKKGGAVADGRYKATCALVNPQGDWVEVYEKYHLFRASIQDHQETYDESKRYEPGSEWVVAQSPWGPLGIAVCFDLRFSEQFLFFRERGVKCVVLPSAFTEETGKAHWEVLLRARAIEHQMYIIAANQGGDHGHQRKTWGHSMIVDPWGHILVHAEQGEAVVSALVDFEEVERVRCSIPMIR